MEIKSFVPLHGHILIQMLTSLEDIVANIDFVFVVCGFTRVRGHECGGTSELRCMFRIAILLCAKGVIAPNQVIARSELEVHRQIYTE